MRYMLVIVLFCDFYTRTHNIVFLSTAKALGHQIELIVCFSACLSGWVGGLLINDTISLQWLSLIHI